MTRARYLAATSVLGLALFGALLPLRGIVAEIVTTNIFLVAADELEDEDLYVASASAKIDGTVEGDLTISTGDLLINGEITGDVFVLSQGTVEVTGTIGGSLRGTARTVIIDGSIGDDLAVAAVTTRVSGTVGRDVLVFGGSFELDGEVKRDISGRMLSAGIDGKVGHDVDIAVGNLTLGPSTVIAGDLLYRSGSDADIAATAQVGSQIAKLPTRGAFGVEVVLTIATILGFFSFLFSGIVLLWLFRRTGPGAVTAVLERPLRAAAIGVGALIALPILVLVLMVTLVGIPVALALLVLLLLALLFGPVPAVTAAGSKMLRGRWGLFAAFFLGATLWRLGIWLIPVVGFGLYLGALVVGLGGWLVAIWEHRRETPVSADLLPRSPAPVGAAVIPSPVGWDAPLAPGSKRDAVEPDDAEEEV
ncbi:MAG: hypothetical protein GY926_03890 [bacterium]|nr:hypothetical protein [bacterium]